MRILIVSTFDHLVEPVLKKLILFLKNYQFEIEFMASADGNNEKSMLIINGENVRFVSRMSEYFVDYCENFILNDGLVLTFSDALPWVDVLIDRGLAKRMIFLQCAPAITKYPTLRSGLSAKVGNLVSLFTGRSRWHRRLPMCGEIKESLYLVFDEKQSKISKSEARYFVVGDFFWSRFNLSQSPSGFNTIVLVLPGMGAATDNSWLFDLINKVVCLYGNHYRVLVKPHPLSDAGFLAELNNICSNNMKNFSIINDVDFVPFAVIGVCSTLLIRFSLENIICFCVGGRHLGGWRHSAYFSDATIDNYFYTSIEDLTSANTSKCKSLQDDLFSYVDFRDDLIAEMRQRVKITF